MAQVKVKYEPGQVLRNGKSFGTYLYPSCERHEIPPGDLWIVGEDGGKPDDPEGWDVVYVYHMNGQTVNLPRHYLEAYEFEEIE
jgi:hypothetical protein